MPKSALPSLIMSAFHLGPAFLGWPLPAHCGRSHDRVVLRCSFPEANPRRGGATK